MTLPGRFSRRERQIMDVLYRSGQATVSEVLAELEDPPGYSAVRALLNILEAKGHVSHDRDGVRYIYKPARSRSDAAKSALSQLVTTFFGGSVEQAVASLVSDPDGNLTRDELDRMAELIERAREGGDRR